MFFEVMEIREFLQLISQLLIIQISGIYYIDRWVICIIIKYT